MPANVSLATIARMTHTQRSQRQAEKRAKILDLARRFGWLDAQAGAELLQITRTAAGRTLASLVSEGLLYAHEVPGPPRRVWYSITETGMAEAYYLSNLQLPAVLPVGRWKIAVQNYQHEQTILLFAVRAEAGGASARLPKAGASKAAQKEPDLLIDSGGKTYAIEIEREVKSQRRYREIVASHWLAMERGKYDAVMYLTSTKALRDRLGRVVRSTYSSIKLGGRERALTPDEQKRIKFGIYEDAIGFFAQNNKKEA